MMKTFKTLGLSGETLKGVLSAGYTSPTPIQTAAIPPAISGRDLIGCAQTGTGKTAAFVLPMLQRLTNSPVAKKRRTIRALVVAPTRELALQVETAIQTYGAHTRLRSVAIYGGVGLPPQIKRLRYGVDIVVATPGRLLDLMDRGHVDLSGVEILVLDEADRMLDMGFINDIRKIVARTPEQRQTLLFSATMPKAIQELTRSIQHQPELIEIGERRNPAETVVQHVCRVSPNTKMDLLCSVLNREVTDNVIVFSRTKHRADRIARRLGKQGFTATVMHSNRSQNQRQRALDGFRDGRFQILVATDIAARGIDVDGISHVINYDTPRHAEDYIHRIGRTGRAESSGEAITFVTREEEQYLRAIERHTGQRLSNKTLDGFEVDSVDTRAARGDKRRRTSSQPNSNGSGANGRSRSGGKPRRSHSR